MRSCPQVVSITLTLEDPQYTAASPPVIFSFALILQLAEESPTWVTAGTVPVPW